MKRIKIPSTGLALLATLSLFGAGSASAELITFDGLADFANSYTEDGFNFDTPNGNHMDNCCGFAGSLGFHDGGANAIFENVVTMTSMDGLFNLLQLDIVSNNAGGILFQASNGLNVTVFGTGTVAFGLAGISWFSMESNSTSISTFVDNVIADAVPEPGTTALLGLGLLLVGLKARRKKV